MEKIVQYLGRTRQQSVKSRDWVVQNDDNPYNTENFKPWSWSSKNTQERNPFIRRNTDVLFWHLNYTPNTPYLPELPIATIMHGPQSYIRYVDFEDEFETTEIISQVLEVSSEFIIVNSLINLENKLFQKRKIEISSVKELNFKEGDILKIVIKSKPLEKRFIYSKGEHTSATLFKKEYKGTFKDVINSPFFQKEK